MSKEFKTILPSDIQDNPFHMIKDDWMLVSAKDKTTGKINTMTASWGGLGVLWGKDVCFSVIRPQRHTLQFIENSDYLTLSFYNDSYRDMLQLCGSKSGRECDKIALAGLTPIYDINDSAVYFEEARLVLICRKLYVDNIKENNFIDSDIPKTNYPNHDFHRMYICEIVQVLIEK